MNFTAPRYVILFLNSEIYIVHVINHKWNRSMFVASTVCFVWDTKPDLPTDLNIFNEDLWRFFLLKICSWRFFLEDLFWRFFHWIFENFYEDFFMKIFPLEYGFGDFSFEKWRFFLLKICSWRFFLEDLFWRLNFWKNFNEDLFIEIFPLEYGFWDFSFEKWRFFLLKICSWRFFLKDLF